MTEPILISVSRLRETLPDVLNRILLQKATYLIIRHRRPIAKLEPHPDAGTLFRRGGRGKRHSTRSIALNINSEVRNFLKALVKCGLFGENEAAAALRLIERGIEEEIKAGTIPAEQRTRSRS